MADEEVFWRQAQWELVADTIPSPGVHPAWQEVLDRRQAARLEAALDRAAAAVRQAVRGAIGQVVRVRGRAGRIEATCAAGVVVRWAEARCRECLPWSDVGNIRAQHGSELDLALSPNGLDSCARY